LTTSHRPETGNPTTTYTIYSRSVEHATDESKTVPYSVFLGVMTDSNNNKGRGVPRVLRVLNDLLPVAIRPIKSKRAHRRRYLGLRHRLFTFRMVWRSHYKKKLKAKLRLTK
jgi:hypothetical protein